MSDQQDIGGEVQAEKQSYAPPTLQLLGPVKQLTLGGSNGASEAGSNDENESKP